VSRAIVWAAILFAPLARADESFWGELADPRLREFEAHLQAGRDIVLSADEEDFGRLVDLQAALTHFDRAIALRPEDPRGHYLRGRALVRGKVRIDEAIESLHRARRLDPAGDIEEDVSFELGIALTIAGERSGARALEEALAWYEKNLTLAVVPSARSVTLSNSAEILMRLGRLSEAIDRYEAALAEIRIDDPGGAMSRTLAHYGMAVALDRDDQRTRALEVMRQGWGEDPNRADPHRVCGTLSEPERNFVFFVPEHDIFYYVGLQLEARAAAETDADIRRSLLEAAASSWREFLASGGAAGPWARQAREHAAQIDRRPRGGLDRPRPRH
jgi:tetratricopeptide (TPR) repeat protein